MYILSSAVFLAVAVVIVKAPYYFNGGRGKVEGIWSLTREMTGFEIFMIFYILLTPQ